MEVTSGLAQAEQGNVPENGSQQPVDTSSWRNTVHQNERNTVYHHLLMILMQNKAPLNEDDKKKVEKLCLHIEQKLWSSCKSKEEYTNLDQIKNKLVEYTLRRKATAAQQQQQQAQRDPNTQQILPPAAAIDPMAMLGGGNDLAVAGAPAGMSTAESGHKSSDTTLIQTLHQNNIYPNHQPLGFMSNGAPVLLRGGGGSNAAAAAAAAVGTVTNALGTSYVQSPMLLPTIKQEQQVPAPSLGMIPMGNGIAQHGQQSSPIIGGFIPQSSIGGSGVIHGQMVPAPGTLNPLPGIEGLDEPFPVHTNTAAHAANTNNNNTMATTHNMATASAAATNNNNNTSKNLPQSQNVPQTLEERKSQILKQQRWLLFLRHCAKCNLSEQECPYKANCTVAKQLWEHVIKCKLPQCTYPRCTPSRELLKHHQRCVSPGCPVCAPVKQYVSKQREAMLQKKLKGLTPEQMQAYMNAKKLREQKQQLLAAQQLAASSGAGGGGGGGSGITGMEHHTDGGNTDASLAPIVVAKRPRLILQENMGTSLMEYLNEEQITKHMHRLSIDRLQAPPRRQTPAQPTFDNNGFGFIEEESQCLICHANKLTFEPPMIYCDKCGQRIKRNQAFYATPSNCDIKRVWCHPCFVAQPGDTQLDSFVNKSQMEKKKHIEQEEEPWVQCDRCDAWVHQICGLFNKGRNNEERGYFCPSCLLHGLKTGTRSIPSERPQAMLSSKDLPRCELSDFIEQRLAQNLAKERAQRAATLCVDIENVPTAQGLTVRVINNVEKTLEVKMGFADTFTPQGYPKTFLYRQKVIVLFQQFEGVDMCLYCLYMQEYPDDCPEPNKRSVYLSYVDSVKYLQPEKVEASGFNAALRTMLYHDILLGYCDFVKQRGYCSMYIWACPPQPGDDYIFYCHPQGARQKVPRSDRLREWYLTMLRRGASEGIVVHVSNLFDTFFQGGKDHNVEKPSATHLPYLEGDYWPGEAETLLAQMNGGDVSGPSNPANAAVSASTTTTTTTTITATNSNKKSGKEKRLRALAPDATPGEHLLSKLAESITKMKYDFIVAHFYESCSHCRQFIDGGLRYYHPCLPGKVTIKSERTFDGIALDKPGSDSSRTVQLTRFQLCEECHSRELGGLADKKPLGLPIGIDIHDLIPAQCPPIPPTHDPIPAINNEFFDTRTNFLSLCQGNHYQFDSLRRARHSSMMVLYHLHNPSEPAFSATCSVCSCEIKPDEAWRCNVCSDFDMCMQCHNNPNITHPHPLQLTAGVRKFDETRMRLTEEDRMMRDKALQRTMALLVHASACQKRECPSSNCAKVKALFSHAVNCTKKIVGGCMMCRRMWALLQAHAKVCTSVECPVPRCKELRQLRRKQTARQEEKRRAAYRQMIQNQNDDGCGGGGSVEEVGGQ